MKPVTVLALVLALAASLPAASAARPLELTLHLVDEAIPSHGVVAGELRIRNAGQVICHLGGVMDVVGGALAVDLERPDGSVVELHRTGQASPHTIQHACLDPGDEISVPVCLLKFEGEYLFTLEGLHRVRVAYGRHAIRARSTETGEATGQRPPRGESDWVKVRVGPVARGRARYVRSHPWPDLAAAFRSDDRIATVRGGLGGWRGYEREQVKLLLFQDARPAVAAAVRSGRSTRELAARAEAMQNLALEHGAGVEMWSWIAERLWAELGDEPPPHVSCLREGWYF